MGLVHHTGEWGWCGCNGSSSGGGLTVQGDDGNHIVLQWFEMKWKKEKEKRKTYLGVKWVGLGRASVCEWQAQGGG